MNGHEQFRQRLGEISGQPVSEAETAEAHRNLSGFMSLLMKINEREQIVPTKPPRKPPHENH
jgi:hypothetical protein